MLLGSRVRCVSVGSQVFPEDQEKVFERFYRGDKSRTREVEGVGLGLSLTREIARAHGGDLVLDDGPGDMTAFSLRVPLAS
jgi:signal transduction histidine kinase